MEQTNTGCPGPGPVPYPPALRGCPDAGPEGQVLGTAGRGKRGGLWTGVCRIPGPGRVRRPAGDLTRGSRARHGEERKGREVGRGLGTVLPGNRRARTVRLSDRQPDRLRGTLSSSRAEWEGGGPRTFAGRPGARGSGPGREGTAESGTEHQRPGAYSPQGNPRSWKPASGSAGNYARGRGLREWRRQTGTWSAEAVLTQGRL